MWDFQPNIGRPFRWMAECLAISDFNLATGSSRVNGQRGKMHGAQVREFNGGGPWSMWIEGYVVGDGREDGRAEPVDSVVAGIGWRACSDVGTHFVQVYVDVPCTLTASWNDHAFRPAFSVRPNGSPRRSFVRTQTPCVFCVSNER